MRVPKRRGETDRQALAQPADAYLTPEAIERMKRTLARLEGVERQAAAQELRRTAEMGDLSENAAYQAAKYELRRINSRILTLEERLKQAIPIGKGNTDGTVAIGSTVRLRADGRDLSFTILGSAETDPTRGRISYRSPLGMLLMGKCAGAHVTLKTAGGETAYEVVSVS